MHRGVLVRWKEELGRKRKVQASSTNPNLLLCQPLSVNLGETAHTPSNRLLSAAYMMPSAAKISTRP